MSIFWSKIEYISNKITQKWIDRLPDNGIEDCVIDLLKELIREGNFGNEKKLISLIEDLEGYYTKELSGLPVKRSHRRSGARVCPCPEDKLASIQDTFRYFGMMGD